MKKRRGVGLRVWGVIGPRSALALCLAASGCGAGADHELIGDRRYAEHAWVDAVAEYRMAARQHQPTLALQRKLGLAALHAGALGEAVTAYRDMARTDPSASLESADGLVRTARLALTSNDAAALRAAVLVLHEIAPSRSLGLVGGEELARAMDQERGGAATADMVLAGAATSGSVALRDSLLVVWGDLTSRSGRCDQAARAYEGVLRHQPGAVLARAARGGLAGCAIEEGRAALAVGHLDDADSAFHRAIAIAIGVPDSAVRLAWLLIGDARWANGDTAIAQEAYRKAAAGGSSDDPIVRRAEEQLRKLLGTGNPQP